MDIFKENTKMKIKKTMILVLLSLALVLVTTPVGAYSIEYGEGALKECDEAGCTGYTEAFKIDDLDEWDGTPLVVTYGNFSVTFYGDTEEEEYYSFSWISADLVYGVVFKAATDITVYKYPDGANSGDGGTTVHALSHLTFCYTNDVPGTPVPEPTILVLLGLGLVGVVGMRRKVRS